MVFLVGATVFPIGKVEMAGSHDDTDRTRSVQHARAKRRAAELGISLADYIQRLPNRDLATTEAEADLASIIGMFASGESDIANQRSDAIRATVAAQTTRRQL